LPHPAIVIGRSCWASRGWTFKEAILSARRLVFTEYQVYFECQLANHCEAGSAPILRDSLFPNGVFGSLTSNSSPPEIFEHISVYTGRSLTVNHQNAMTS
jgi:hypothetical protein